MSHTVTKRENVKKFLEKRKREIEREKIRNKKGYLNRIPFYLLHRKRQLLVLRIAHLSTKKTIKTKDASIILTSCNLLLASLAPPFELIVHDTNKTIK